MRIVYQKGMFNIDNKNTDNSLYFSLTETKGCSVLSGMQCDYKEDSPEYKAIMQKCLSVYDRIKELEEFL